MILVLSICEEDRRSEVKSALLKWFFDGENSFVTSARVPRSHPLPSFVFRGAGIHLMFVCLRPSPERVAFVVTRSFIRPVNQNSPFIPNGRSKPSKDLASGGYSDLQPNHQADTTQGCSKLVARQRGGIGSASVAAAQISQLLSWCCSVREMMAKASDCYAAIFQRPLRWTLT